MASVAVSGSTAAVTPVSAGTSAVTVTATDATGSNRVATQSFVVTVLRPFSDHPIVPGETPVRAVHGAESYGTGCETIRNGRRTRVTSAPSRIARARAT